MAGVLVSPGLCISETADRGFSDKQSLEFTQNCEKTKQNIHLDTFPVS